MPRSWGRQKPPVGSRINRTHPMGRRLIGCWLLNEQGGNTLFDLTGRSNATGAGLPVRTARGAIFDRVDDVYDTAAGTFLNAVAGGFTVVISCRPTNITDCALYEKGAINTEYSMMLESGAFKFRVISATVVKDTFSAITADVWSQVAGVYDGANINAYVNRVVGTPTAVTSVDTASSAARIGGLFYAPYLYAGEIEYVYVFDRALNSHELDTLYIDPYCVITPPRALSPWMYLPGDTQEGFRWRNDDGSETAATWIQSQDVNITVPVLSTKRIRVLIDKP